MLRRLVVEAIKSGNAGFMASNMRLELRDTAYIFTGVDYADYGYVTLMPESSQLSIHVEHIPNVLRYGKVVDLVVYRWRRSLYVFGINENWYLYQGKGIYEELLYRIIPDKLLDDKYYISLL